MAIVVFGCLILGLLWGGIFFDAPLREEAALDQARRDTTNYAIAFREDVLRTITAIDQLMLVIKEEYAIDPDRYRLPAWLKKPSFFAPVALEVTIAASDGRVQQSNVGPGAIGADLSDRAHFRYHLDPTAPQPYIGAPVMGRVSGHWAMPITRRLERADGSFAGVLIVPLNPFHLSRFFDEIDLGKEGSLSLIGRDGIVRARRAKGDVIGQDLRNTDFFAQMLKAEHGTSILVSPTDRVRRLRSFAAIPGYPLFAVVGVSVDEVLSRVRAENHRDLLLKSGISLFIALLVAVLLREAIRRQQRERAMASQAGLLATILDVSPTAIWVKDDQGRIEIANDMMAQIYKTPKEKLVGRRAGDLLRSDIAQRLVGWDAEAFANPGRNVGGEYAINFDSGTFYFLTFRRACDIGERKMLVGSAVEVTQLRQAEEALRTEMKQREIAEAQLRQAQKMEAIGKLTGGVAHDFNNLLTTILGNLELLQRREHDSAKLRLVQNAMRAAQRGATLVQHLLAFARRQRLQPQMLNLNRVVLDMKEMLDRALGPSIVIESSLDADLWPVMADPNQLEAALLNVAINARDAMPEGGRLTIRTANVGGDGPARPTELPLRDYVQIALADTGIGMDGNVAARAFEPFFTTKEVGKGSGLGLSQVYGMAQQSGGTVTLSSSPGQGTVVNIYLPRAEIRAVESTHPPPFDVTPQHNRVGGR